MRKIAKINADDNFESWVTRFCRKSIYLGCAANQMKILSECGYNEFIVTNVSKRITRSFIDGISLAVRVTNPPITVTGNILYEDIISLRDSGVDRVFFGAHNFEKKRLIETALNTFGVQSVGASLIIDSHKYHVRKSSGQIIDTIPHTRLLINPNSCSEILFHSWHGDGLENDSKLKVVVKSIVKDKKDLPFLTYGGCPIEGTDHYIRSIKASVLNGESLIQPYE